jgi:hypothetical protein
VAAATTDVIANFDPSVVASAVDAAASSADQASHDLSASLEVLKGSDLAKDPMPFVHALETARSSSWGTYYNLKAASDAFHGAEPTTMTDALQTARSIHDAVAILTGSYKFPGG